MSNINKRPPRNRRGKSQLPDVQEVDHYDPRVELRIAKSCSPTQRRHISTANDTFFEGPCSGPMSVMYPFNNRHRVHDWINFDVKKLVGGVAPSSHHHPPPRSCQRGGYYFKSQIPGRVSRKTLRNMGDLEDDPPLCSSELRGPPRPNVWDRFNDIRETSSNYFFDDHDNQRQQRSYMQRPSCPLSLQVHSGATSNGDSKSPASSKISYDSTGPNDERYYGKYFSRQNLACSHYFLCPCKFKETWLSALFK